MDCADTSLRLGVVHAAHDQEGAPAHAQQWESERGSPNAVNTAPAEDPIATIKERNKKAITVWMQEGYLLLKISPTSI